MKTDELKTITTDALDTLGRVRWPRASRGFRRGARWDAAFVRARRASPFFCRSTSRRIRYWCKSPQRPSVFASTSAWLNSGETARSRKPDGTSSGSDRQMAQSGACNRFHNASQRLCRWLLMSHDRVQTDTIPRTQEFIGHMLGADRKRVSAAAARLQDAGVIRQRHGQITILNRRGLESRACECDAVVRGKVSDRDGLPPRPSSNQVRSAGV